ncbi:MAG: PQQ-like beta-propeller repeat protein [Gemmataceae bacterium]|nr:PQQ-like beta-propeller repeat protein [Gemmataceae bacterium]
MSNWNRASCALIVILLAASTSPAADWPHWLGPNRNGSSPETGLLTTWPSTGPKILWQAKGGDGYSSIAVADGRAITLVQRGGQEVVVAFDAVKGTPLWETPLAPAYKNQYGNGPRSTPAIDGGSVYVTSVNGPIACLDVKTGKIVWQHDLLKEFGGKQLTWGLSASPTVEGDLVLAIPGAKGAGVAAFDKKTGKLAWKSGDDKPGYATPIGVSVGDARQLIFFTATELRGVGKDGKELWRVPWETEFDCNICTPLVVGAKLFVTSGEGVGSALFQLSADAPPKELWRFEGEQSPMTNYWANAVHHEGHLYGLSGEFVQEGKRIELRCVELATGKVKWAKKGFGKAAVTLADGHLFLTTKKGDLVLVRATPEKYEEKGRVTILGENRTVGTIANKRLYLRDRAKIVCVDLGAGN